MIVEYNYKEELVDNFQQKNSEIMSWIDPDMIDAINSYINLAELPYRIEDHKTLGIVLVLILDQSDINTSENQRIMSAYDIYHPGQVCIGNVRAGTIADIISTIKIMDTMESVIREAIHHLDRTIKAAYEKSENM